MMTANSPPDESNELGRRDVEGSSGQVGRGDLVSSVVGPHDLLESARRRFRELAARSVEKGGFQPEIARAVVHSLELGFAQTIKEDGPVIQRQFGGDVEGAVTWGAERLLEACRHLASDGVGEKRSGLQNLALLEVQALQRMLPKPGPTNAGESSESSVPAGQLQAFCSLLNDGLDWAEQAESAADRGEQRAYRRNFVLSRTTFRDAARLLRRMVRAVGSERGDLAEGLHGFRLELAAHVGSLRMFLKALSARNKAVQSPHCHAQILDPHCVIEDLLPTLFHRHFAFSVRTPRGVSSQRSQELVTAAHDVMWQRAANTITVVLDQPEQLQSAAFRQVVEQALRAAIDEVNDQFAEDGVVIAIESNCARQITRREW